MSRTAILLVPHTSQSPLRFLNLESDLNVIEVLTSEVKSWRERLT